MTATTTAIVEGIEETEEVATSEQLILRLRPPSSPPHVTWAADVIDNEHLGRLKSNCCCIYVKPRKWDDPTTWEQDEFETEHCRGHTLPLKKQPSGDDGDNKDNEKHGDDIGKTPGDVGGHGGCGSGCC